MALRIRVDSNVAFVQMGRHGLRQRTGGLGVRDLLPRHGLLSDEHGDAGTLRLVVLAGDVQDRRADDVGYILEYLGQASGVVLFVDIGDVSTALFGGLVANLTALLLQGPLSITQGGTFEQFSFGTQLVVSLGAGLYEELLFRVLLVSGLLALGAWAGMRTAANIAVSVVLSALIFSGFHYVGPYGDPLTLSSFTFRAIAGLLLSGLYVARGFGIVAWTHALYDVSLASL